MWMVSDFRETKGAIGRIWTSVVKRALCAAFRVATGLRVPHFPDYVSAIVRAGFQLRNNAALHTTEIAVASASAAEIE